jgi:hypothetical protein
MSDDLDMDLDALLDDIENGSVEEPATKAEAPPTPKKATPPPAMGNAAPTTKPGHLPDRPETFVNMDKFKEDVTFNIQDMQSAFVDQAALYVHYAHAKAKAHMQAKRFKQRMELTEAKMDTAIRRLAAQDSEKITEGAITKRIQASIGFQEAKEQYLEADHIYELLSEIVESFRHRRDMLIQAGADVRAEKQTSLRMNESPAGRKENLLDARAKTA